MKKSVLQKSKFRCHRTGNLGGTEKKVGSNKWLAQNVVVTCLMILLVPVVLLELARTTKGRVQVVVLQFRYRVLVVPGDYYVPALIWSDGADALHLFTILDEAERSDLMR